jgi:hypothetical protein
VSLLTPEQVWLNSSAAKCIEWNESTDGRYSDNLWQIEDGTWQAKPPWGVDMPGSAGDYPDYVQDAKAYQLYLQRGWEPWTTRYVCGL